MSSVSTVRLFQQIRARIVGFTSHDGHTVASELGTGDAARLFYAQAPDDVTKPYATARFINQQVTNQGARFRADLEIMLFDRPRARQLAAELLADWIKGSLNGYRDGSDGFLMVNPPSGDTLPPVPSPGDSDLVQIRIVAEVIAYPRFLTQYAIPGS